ncbi:MAG: hypothetical protein GY696_29635 [Gammaproteobacteria bacterium]|nr:hypothetical protein [Gammaproteobacteria bacterium]
MGRPKHALSDEEKDFLLNHISQLPCQESHYCRSNTTQRYILRFRSIEGVWESYKAVCAQQEPPIRAAMFSTFDHY